MKIICVDRSALSLSRLRSSVRRIVPDASVRCCRETKEALAFADSDGCDVLLSEMDLGSSKWDGLKLAQSIKKFHPNVNIIFITALSERECAEELIRLRISGFLAKPWVEETLAEEFRNLRYPVAGFIAKSADAQAEIPQELSREKMEAVSGGTQHLGIYQSGFQHKDAALAFFRKCVGEETFHRAMNSTERKRHHYVAARICLNQADWEKFVWIEKYGSLDGFPEH